MNHFIQTYFRVAPRGYEPPLDGYRSRFGFIWWFWFPRLHMQKPDPQNPRVIRLIWLCFYANMDIWGPESMACWPIEIKDGVDSLKM